MLGRTISHYRIVRELGAGGMGVVFAAEDVRLGRQVAIKFVPDGVSDDRQMFERLRSEARTASALNHPNICTLYDIGDHEGRPFIVMELLQGRTLRDRLSAGPLKVDETLDIGVQVADALDAAHRQHIIHRDIKPANLFLNERGPVKILDFGLAKYVSHHPSALTAAPTDLTAAGTTLGTVSYMSPEQVTGDPLDGRSDLFSFGVVLYECVTGHQPFKGKTSGVILSEILNRTPAAPLQLNPDLPLRLQEIITNCLEKDRELRYQDAAALRTDLKRLKRDLESGPRAASRLDIPIEAAPSATQTISVAMPSTGSPPSRRSRGVIGMAIAAVVVASSIAAFFVFRSSSTPRQSASVEAPEQSSAKTDDVPPTAPPVQPAPVPPTVERTQEPPRPPVASSRSVVTPPPAVSEPALPGPAATTAVAPIGIATPPPPIAVPPASSPLPEVPRPTPTPASSPAVSASTPPSSAAASAEEDEAAIRRAVAAYARAIEAKDLDAFKTVKPNLSAAEQRRLEESFRAVASQKVDINVLSIERRGSTAAVKLRRRDTLTAGGRSQTSASQQTLTLIRSGAGWVISEIGR